MNFSTVAFYTLGCKVNQYETESLKKQFLDYGLKVVDFEDESDIYIINSCTVTSIADRKTRNMLRRAKKRNPKSIVIATGCYAQTNGEELDKIKEIDFVVGNSDKSAILNLVRNLGSDKNSQSLLVRDIFDEKEYEELESSTLREMSRAYIKIQDGCDNFCSYCKIPFARGHKRSRKVESVVAEALKLVEEGFKEIILIGINLGAYGEDLEEDVNLEILLEKLVEVEGLDRIRLGSIYPDKINEHFIRLLKENKKLVPHLHISLQSGDDEILSLMKRKYSRKDIVEVLKKLKNEVEDIELTGDVIVGFPFEKEENFENTYELIKEINFSDLHIFQYSDREYTLASTYDDKIPSEVKKSRADRLENLRMKMFVKTREKYVGKKLKILVEEIKDDIAYGYTENYLKAQIDNYKGEANGIATVVIKEFKKGMLISECEN